MPFSRVGAAATAAIIVAGPVAAQMNFQITRANLANTASFTVTQTTAPKGGSKVSQVFRIEVKGNKARVDVNDPMLGTARYLANDKGVFLYIPANKVAQKQSLQGGVEGALKLAFSQVAGQMRGAKRVGTATVSGQVTDVYKDPKTGGTIYIGRNKAFRLPVKTELSNEGGTRTVLVSNIKTNVPLSDARFALPAGVQIIESNGGGSPGGAALPGLGR